MRLQTAFRLGALAAIMMSLNASVTLGVTIKDSNDFTHKYEGDYPVPNYTEVAGFTTAPSSDGNVLTFATPDVNGGYFDSTQWGGAVDNATGWTLEWRMQLFDDVAEGSGGTFQLAVGDSAGFRAFRLFKNFFTTRFPTDITLDTNSNTDDFHTFRLAREPGSSDFLVWRDGISLTSAVGSDPAAGNVDFFWFGDGSTTIGGPTVQLDYLRFDNTGGYSPVPEPAAWILMIISATIYGVRCAVRH